MGWGGDDDVPCTCTHVRCYATDGVGMMRSLHLHTCEMLRNSWGGDDDEVHCTCTHVRCYATDGAGMKLNKYGFGEHFLYP